MASPLAYGAAGDGVADDTEPVSEAMADGPVELDHGHTFKVAGLQVTADGVRFFGGGALLLASDDAMLFDVTGDRFRCEGITLDCGGTHGDALRAAMRLKGSGHQVDRVRILRHVGKGVWITGTATDVTLDRVVFSGGLDQNGTSSADADVYIQGSSVARITVSRGHHVPDATNPINIGLFAAADATTTFDHITFDRCDVRGYCRHGIGAADEAPTGDYRAGGVTVEGCTVADAVQQGIKLKNVQRARVAGNRVERCNSIPEGTSLRGGIFLNGLEDVVCTGNTVLDDATSGIRVEGLTANDGQGNVDVSGNIVRRSGEAGIYVSQRVFDASIGRNKVHGCNVGIRVTSGGAVAPARIDVAGNHVRQSTSHGILLDGTEAVTVDRNHVTGSSLFGILVGSSWASNDTRVSRNHVAGSGQHGIRAGKGDGIHVEHNRSTGQGVGLSFASGATSTTAMDNDLRGNTQGMSGDPKLSANNWVA